MILGFGGVGKTTFCAAATRELDEMPHFQRSLTPLPEWDGAMMASWARCLGTEWSPAAASVLEAHGVRGDGLQARGPAQGDSTTLPLLHPLLHCHPLPPLFF